MIRPETIFGAMAAAAIGGMSTYASMMEFHDGSWSEPTVTEKPRRRKVYLPVINTHAKPLRDRKRLLARKSK